VLSRVRISFLKKLRIKSQRPQKSRVQDDSCAVGLDPHSLSPE